LLKPKGLHSNLIPLSRPEYLTVIFILIFSVTIWTFYSVLHPRIDSTDRNVVGAGILKDIDPTALPRDTLFATTEIYGYYTPAYRAIVATAWQFAGSFEQGYIWLLPFVMTGYLLGMAALLWYVTRNIPLTLGLTIAAAHYHNVMGASGWGVGSSATLGARVFFMPAAPFLFIILLRLVNKLPLLLGEGRGEVSNRLPLLIGEGRGEVSNQLPLLIGEGRGEVAAFGLFLGLATNLHPISGFHLLMLTGLFLLIWQRQRAILPLIIITLTTMLTAAPFIWHFSQHRAVATSLSSPLIQGGERGVDFARFSQIVTELYGLPFSPERFTWPLFQLDLTRPTLDYLVWFYLATVIILPFVAYRWPRLTPHVWLISSLITLAYVYLITLFETPALILFVSLYAVYRFHRRNATQLDQWLLSFMGLVVLYAFVGYYFFTYLWQTFALIGLTSFLTEFARAAALVYLPLYALSGLAGLACAKELTAYFNLPQRSQVDLNLALLFALAPSLMAQWSNNVFQFVIYSIILLALWLAWLWLTRHLALYKLTTLFAILTLLLLFNPLTARLSDYLPLPPISTLQPEPLYPPAEAELYTWTQQNTAHDSLFYGCFGPVTLTQFRLRTARSLSHNWKDMTFYLHSRAGLVTAYNRFRQLEAACHDFDSLIAAAHTVQADYLLVSSDKITPQLPPPCFHNDKYAIFALKSNGCLVK